MSMWNETFFQFCKNIDTNMSLQWNAIIQSQLIPIQLTNSTFAICLLSIQIVSYNICSHTGAFIIFRSMNIISATTNRKNNKIINNILRFDTSFIAWQMPGNGTMKNYGKWHPSRLITFAVGMTFRFSIGVWCR